ncbi:MAG: thiamine phosphate synthase [bacterium]|nr:thiamine phosphate synthase [bacterium]
MAFNPKIFCPVYAIVDTETLGKHTSAVAQVLFDAGVKILQLRGKNLNTSSLSQLSADIVARRNNSKSTCRIIINDNIEACLTSGADGVHLGQDDSSPHQARKLLGQAAIIGLSTHNIEEVDAANKLSGVIDYIGFGPVFPSGSKSGHAEVTGLELLAVACQTSNLPLVAIGGIRRTNARDVIRAGAQGFAVIGDLCDKLDLVTQAGAAAPETMATRLEEFARSFS